jgi:hypothetical protein
MITGFEDNARFEFFGRKRDHALCPHCGKTGQHIADDDSQIVWGSNRVDDMPYTCVSCQGQWTIRRYHQTGYERYPSPPFACIYIPQKGETP